MANQFIKDLVRKERTQANLTGMTVDTQSRFLMNPMSTELIATPKPNANIPEYKNIFFEKLEEFAGWAENLKINNEKSKLKIAMQKMDLDLEERWRPRENTDKYREAYGEYTQERMKVYNEKQKLIRSCNYLTQEEKQKGFTDLKMSLNTDNYNQNGKRTKIFTADQIADAVANIQERGEITANFGLDKDTEAQENYRDILNDYRQIAKLTGEQPKITLNKAINEITKIEATRLHKDMQAKLSDPNLTEAKMREIENQLKNFENSEVHKALAREFVDKIGIKTEDKEQTLEYIKTSFGNRIGTLSKSINTSIKVIRRQRQAEARRRQREYQRIKKEAERHFSKAEDNRDFASLYYGNTIKSGIDKPYEERKKDEIKALETNNLEKSEIFKYTGKDLRDINRDGEYVRNYVPPQEIRDMAIEVQEMTDKGVNKEVALVQVAKKMADKNNDYAELLVNSYTANGGFTKRIDIEIAAERKNKEALNKKRILNNFDSDCSYAPRDLGESIRGEINATKTAQDFIKKLVEKGIPHTQAVEVVGTIKAGIMSRKIGKRNNKRVTSINEFYSINLDAERKSADEIMAHYVNNEISLEAIAESISPRAKRKAVKLKGIRKGIDQE